MRILSLLALPVCAVSLDNAKRVTVRPPMLALAHGNFTSASFMGGKWNDEYTTVLRHERDARLQDDPSMYILPGGLPDPYKYFLTKDELQLVRNSKLRNGLHIFSTDNSIKYLPNGDVFMRRLLELLEGTQKGDFVYATFWELNPDVMLDPDPENRKKSKRSRLLYVLNRAALRGVTIRVLYSGHMMNWNSVDAVCARLNRACGEGTCVADFRHSDKFRGSSHAKTWMIRHGDELTAFSGSMDIGNSRWDTAAHDTTAPAWKMQPLDAARQFAWRGEMFEIVGPAAEDILATFYQRWNDGASAQAASLWDTVANTFSGVMQSCAYGPPCRDSREYPKLDPWIPESFYTGTVAAQVVRSFGCSNRPLGMEDMYADFAPDGELSYAAAWFKSLRAARKYIFVADQFMWFAEAMDAVVEAAAHVDFVIIVTDTGKISVELPVIGKIDTDVYASIIQHYQYEAILGALHRKDPTGALAKKVHLFTLVKEGKDGSDPHAQIYDHEKTLLIDDEFALVGSIGVELIGFTNDADLSVGIYDRTFVTDLRKQIFEELLQTPRDSPRLATPSGSLELFLERADTGSARVRHHTPQPLELFTVTAHLAPQVYNFINVDGRCKGEKRMAWDVARNGLTGSRGRVLRKQQQ